MTISKLLALDVKDLVEKKSNLTYLSWSHAWSEALKADPAVTFHVETFQRADSTTVPYMDVNGTAMVWVRVTIFGKEMTCFLPVMDHRNKPIPDPDAFQVNTAIMRCMTKALALHGLGLHIYAGEDLPMGSDADPVKETPKATKATKTVDPFAEAPAVEPPKVEAEKAKEKPKASNRADAELFADGMIQFLDVCKSSSGLSSYWSSNQEKIDSLKVDHLDLFTKVRDAFSVMKAKLKEKEAQQ